MAVGRVKQNIVARVVGRRRSPRLAIRWAAPAAGWAAATSPMRRRDFAATRTSWPACGAWRPGARISAATPPRYGFKVDYPNDLWDIQLTYKRIGRDFDPSIGFVPRRAVHLYNGQINNRTRLARGPASAAVSRVHPVARDRPVRTLGELSRLHRAGELAVPQRRSVRAQRQPDRRAPGRRRSKSRTASSFRPARTTGGATASRSAPRRNAGSTRS